MAKCPKCNDYIEYLVHTAVVTVTWDFSLSSKGYTDYDNRDIGEDEHDGAFECPECGHTIARCEDDAVDFLKQIDEDNPEDIDEMIETVNEAIDHWKKNVEGEPLSMGVSDCPLCQKYMKSGHDCGHCPVYAYSGYGSCEGTPYEELIATLTGTTLRNANEEGLLPIHRYLAQNEVAYLEKIRDQLIEHKQTL